MNENQWLLKKYHLNKKVNKDAVGYMEVGFS